MTTENTNISKTCILYSIIVAFFCSIKTVNVYLTRDIETEGDKSGPMAMMYVLTAVVLCIVSFMSRSLSLKYMSKRATFLILTVVLFYIVTLNFIGPPYTSPIFFGVFTVFSFLIPFIATIDVRLFIKMIMIFSLPAIMVLDKVFAPLKYYLDYVSMGVSYSFLTPVIASVVYVACFYKQENLIQKIITILSFTINLVYAYNLFSLGSRGPVFAILSVVAFLFFLKHNTEYGGIKYTRLKIILGIITIVILYFTFIPVLTEIQVLLSDYDLSFRFIDKFVNLNQEDDITNGRDIVYDIVLTDISSSPLWGWGLDQLANQHHDLNYPHNFILQIIYDGGILFLIFFVVCLYKDIVTIWKRCTIEEYALFSLLFFSSVPGALFSDDLWKNSSLWVFFGALLSKTFVNKNNNITRSP